MAKKNSTDYRAAKLRRRAEERLTSEVHSPELPQEPGELVRLIHELHVHQVELEIQNEELRETQQALEVSRDRYADLYDFAPIGYLSFDELGRILSINLTGAAMLGRERALLIEQPFSPWLSNRAAEALFTHLRIAFRSQHKVTTELKLKGGLGPIHYVRLESMAVSVANGEPDQCRTAMIDITEIKHAQAQLEDLLEQKEAKLQENSMLLKEMHHRVKNNMQLVSSLLGLQALKLEGSATSTLHQAIKDSQKRIMSMGLVHENLYRSEDLVHVDFRRYAQMLVQDLYHMYRSYCDAVTLEFHCDEIKLGIDKAVPCGMILNELYSNSMKHAFPEDRAGRIEIVIHRQPGQWLELTFGDDGVGLPGQLVTGEGNTVGLTLVKSLVRQLYGEIDIQLNGGTRFRIRFKP